MNSDIKLTHCHEMRIGVSALLIIHLELIHPSCESWDEGHVVRFCSSLLPQRMKLFKGWQSMLECQHWGCRECLLRIIGVLLPVDGPSSISYSNSNYTTGGRTWRMLQKRQTRVHSSSLKTSVEILRRFSAFVSLSPSPRINSSTD